jgi:hypothetical protein
MAAADEVDHGATDFAVAYVLSKLGVLVEDAKDSHGLLRLLFFGPTPS